MIVPRNEDNKEGLSVSYCESSQHSRKASGPKITEFSHSRDFQIMASPEAVSIVATQVGKWHKLNCPRSYVSALSSMQIALYLSCCSRRYL